MNFEPPFTMIICGNSGSGKTQLLKELLNTKFKKMFNNIFVLCPSMDFSGDYDEFKDEKKNKRFKDRLFDYYESEIIQEIIDEHEEIIRKHGKSKCTQSLIVLDDCLDYIQGNHNIISQLF